MFGSSHFTHEVRINDAGKTFMTYYPPFFPSQFARIQTIFCEQWHRCSSALLLSGKKKYFLAAIISTVHCDAGPGVPSSPGSISSLNYTSTTMGPHPRKVSKTHYFLCHFQGFFKARHRNWDCRLQSMLGEFCFLPIPFLDIAVSPSALFLPLRAMAPALSTQL